MIPEPIKQVEGLDQVLHHAVKVSFTEALIFTPDIKTVSHAYYYKLNCDRKWAYAVLS